VKSYGKGLHPSPLLPHQSQEGPTKVEKDGQQGLSSLNRWLAKARGEGMRGKDKGRKDKWQGLLSPSQLPAKGGGGRLPSSTIGEEAKGLGEGRRPLAWALLPLLAIPYRR